MKLSGDLLKREEEDGIRGVRLRRAKDGIEQLYHSLQKSGQGGRAFLIGGGSGNGRKQLLEESAAQGRLAGLRVVGCSAGDDRTLAGGLAAQIISDLTSVSVSAREYRKIQSESEASSDEILALPTTKPLRSSFAAEHAFIDDLAKRLRAALEQAAGLVLVIIEDLQASDDASAEVIFRLARAYQSRLLVLAACTTIHGAERAGRYFAEFTKLAVHIELADADEKEVRDLLLESGFSSVASSRDALLKTPTMYAAYENGFRQSQTFGPAVGPILTDSVEPCERCDQLIALGKRQSQEGEVELAENTLREAALLAERLQDATRLTQIVLALPAWHWPGPGEGNLLAALLAQRALVIERTDSNRRAILKARLAAELSYAPDLRRYSADLAAGALKEVSATTHPSTELYVRLYRDQILRRPEQLDERLANAEDLLRLAIEAGDFGACCVAALGKSSSLMTMGDMTAADHAADFAIGIVQTSQVKFHRALSAAYRGHRAVVDGQFVSAEEEFGYCRALGETHHPPYLVDACWPGMLMPYAENDRLSELEALAEDTVRRRRSVLVFSALLSWIKIQRGSTGDASFLLERLAADEFSALSSSPEGMAGMAALAEVCAVLNRQDCAAILYERMLPYAQLNVILNPVATFGSAERYIGILALVLDRLDEAIEHFEKSLHFERRRGARLWAVYSGFELVSSLAHRGGTADRAKALDLIPILEAEATGLEMKRTSSKLREVHELVLRDEATPRLASRSSMDTLVQESGLDANHLSVESIERASANGNGQQVATFAANGEYWQVGFEGRTTSVRHRKGFELISVLVGNPGREFFATELTQQLATGGPGGPEDIRIGPSVDTPLLDAEAKRSYRERLREIRDELDQSRDANDIERVAKLEEEQDFLTRELARALGIFGNDRKFGSESERARKRVSIAITRAIRSISRHDERFARHLERSIKTGNLCCYDPDPATPVKWKL
jgi:tetratricopeptide (TPR) repeat protein